MKQGEIWVTSRSLYKHHIFNIGRQPLASFIWSFLLVVLRILNPTGLSIWFCFCHTFSPSLLFSFLSYRSYVRCDAADSRIERRPKTLLVVTMAQLKATKGTPSCQWHNQKQPKAPLLVRASKTNHNQQPNCTECQSLRLKVKERDDQNETCQYFCFAQSQCMFEQYLLHLKHKEARKSPKAWVLKKSNLSQECRGQIMTKAPGCSSVRRHLWWEQSTVQPFKTLCRPVKLLGWREP